MARIRTELVIDATPEAVWQLVTDWPAQSRWIPLTTVVIDSHGPAGPGLGSRFTGRSRLGPLGFDDPMEVTEWQPPVAGVPGRCRIRKLGPWLIGWAEIEVRAGHDGTRAIWSEDIRARWTPRFADRLLDPLLAAVGSALFARTLRKMAAELARTRPE